jgi:hypothetical protein
MDITTSVGIFVLLISATVGFCVGFAAAAIMWRWVRPLGRRVRRHQPTEKTMDQFDRAMDDLERDLEEGVITRQEFDKELRLLRESFQAAAEEEAQRAYDDAMGGW